MRMAQNALMIKRTIDILVSLVAIVVVAPIALVVMLLVLKDVGRPVVFRQVRSGIYGEPFELIKFRTMRNALDENDHSLPDERRITALGRFLRGSSLDEVPELLNVLRGQMSLVGPRPLLPEYLELYSPEQRRRLLAKPGLTGLAQIRGRNHLSWDEKFALDIQYVDGWSLRLDLEILFATPWSVLRRDGISQPGHATVVNFMGNDTSKE